MPKIPLIIDMTKLADLYSGLGQVSLSFAKTLDAFEPLDFDVSFLIKPGQKKLWEKDRNLITTNVLKRYFKVLNRNRGIWHALHQDSAFIPVGGKYILTVHDLNFLQEKTPDKARKRLLRLQKKVDRADLVCFISEYAKRSAEKHLMLKNKPLKVVYNGVPEISENQTQPEIFPQRKFLFNLGVMMPKKNHESLIRMMKHLPEYDLLIGGGGGSQTYKDNLKALAEKEGVSRQIFFAGYLSDQEKAFCLHRAEAFVFPSLNEGFGLPVVEAMSVGLPVFSSDTTSLPEIGGDAAFYWTNFAPLYMANFLRNKMEEISKNKHFSDVLKAQAQTFSWQKNVETYLALYKML